MSLQPPNRRLQPLRPVFVSLLGSSDHLPQEPAGVRGKFGVFVPYLSAIASIECEALCQFSEEDSMIRIALFPALLVATTAFGQGSAPSGHADFVNSQGQKIGTAVNTHTGEAVKIDVSVTQLPTGTHAFHIHAVGKCEIPDFKSAGGHFNPEAKQHGKDNPNGPHAGGMLNVEVGADGTAKFSIVNASVTLGQGPNSLFHEGGTALVIHEKADDYKTDPAGNAGSRIVCGIVRK